MIISQATIRKIREIIEKNYNRLSISVLGNKVFTNEEKKLLKEQGISTENAKSLMTLAYNHNFINPALASGGPTSISDMESQQKVPGTVPEGEAHDYTIDALNESTKQYIEKLKIDISTRIEALIRKNNDEYKMNALQNLNRPYGVDQLIKESSVGKIRQELRDTAEDANRDWMRVAVTEVGNAIGIASVDRIVSENREKNLEEVYVYRIPVNDEKTCKYCRRFYNDERTNYKIYRLATLLANGTNYGKKSDQWKPVIGSTHPNSRTSQTIQIPPGWAIKDSGKLTFIGLDKWNHYIQENLIN